MNKLLVFIVLTMTTFCGASILFQWSIFLWYFFVSIVPALIVDTFLCNRHWSTWFQWNDKSTRHSIGTILLSVGVLCVLTVSLILIGANFQRTSEHYTFTQILSLCLFFGFIVLSEEIGFRSTLFSLIEELTSPISAIVSTSIIFSVLHGQIVQWEIQPMISTFFGGIVLGLLRYKSQNIISSFIFHLLWNIGIMMCIDRHYAIITGFEPVFAFFLPVSTSAYSNHFISEIVSGGTYGIESSYLSILLLIITALFIARYYSIDMTIIAKKFRHDIASNRDKYTNSKQQP